MSVPQPYSDMGSGLFRIGSRWGRWGGRGCRTYSLVLLSRCGLIELLCIRGLRGDTSREKGLERDGMGRTFLVLVSVLCSVFM